MHSRLSLLACVFCSIVTLHPSTNAQPQTPWVEAFGGAESDHVLDAAPAPLEGTYVAGSTSSNGQGGTDAWVARVAANGVSQWEQALGGAGFDSLSSIARTPDGGCILAGSTTSFGAGGSDGWVVKLAANGAIEWQRTYGTAGDESFASVALVKGSSLDQNYYVGGVSEFGATQHDVWILRLDATGNVIWQRNYAGEENDDLTSIAATDTGLVFVANSKSTFASGLAEVPDIINFRPWIATLHSNGDPDQQRTFNLSDGDALHDVQALEDGFVLTGEVLATAFFRGDVWVLRLDLDLNVIWDRRFGDHSLLFVDSGHKVRETPGGGFLVAGSTGTAGAGSEDLYLLRLDSAGNRIADRTLGGPGFDGGNALVLQDNRIIVGGFVQQITPEPVDAYLASLPPNIFNTGHSCAPLFPTGPNEWTSDLELGSPNVQPTNTSALTAPSSAQATPLSTAAPLCL